MISNDFSTTICLYCDDQLTNFSCFKDNIIEFQERLFNYTSFHCVKEEPDWESADIKSETEVLLDNDTSYNTESIFLADIIAKSKPIRHFPSKIDTESAGTKHSQRQKGESKIYQCSECGATATNQRNLKRHIKKSHESLPFSCDFCGYQNPHKQIMTRHMNSHAVSLRL